MAHSIIYEAVLFVLANRIPGISFSVGYGLVKAKHLILTSFFVCLFACCISLSSYQSIVDNAVIIRNINVKSQPVDSVQSLLVGVIHYGYHLSKHVGLKTSITCDVNITEVFFPRMHRVFKVPLRSYNFIKSKAALLSCTPINLKELLFFLNSTAFKVKLLPCDSAPLQVKDSWPVIYINLSPIEVMQEFAVSTTMICRASARQSLIIRNSLYRSSRDLSEVVRSWYHVQRHEQDSPKPGHFRKARQFIIQACCS